MRTFYPLLSLKKKHRRERSSVGLRREEDQRAQGIGAGRSNAHKQGREKEGRATQQKSILFPNRGGGGSRRLARTHNHTHFKLRPVKSILFEELRKNK